MNAIQAKTILSYLLSIGEIDYLPELDNAITTKMVKELGNYKFHNAHNLIWINNANLLESCELFARVVLCPLDQNFPPDPYIKERSIIIPCKNVKFAFAKVAHDLLGWKNDLDDPYVMTPLAFTNYHKGKNVRIGVNTVLGNVRIGHNVKIGTNCSIGLPGFGFAEGVEEKIRFPHVGFIIIENDVEIGNNVCIDRGALQNTVIKKNTKIDNLVHIAHNVVIEENCTIIAQSMIGGSVHIGRNTWIAPSVCIKNKINIGENCVIGMGAVVIRDVKNGTTVVGNPAKELKK